MVGIFKKFRIYFWTWDSLELVKCGILEEAIDYSEFLKIRGIGALLFP